MPLIAMAVPLYDFLSVTTLRISHQIEIATEERFNTLRLLLEISQRCFNSRNQTLKGREVLEMSGIFFDIAPQIFNRVVIG